MDPAEAIVASPSIAEFPNHLPTEQPGRGRRAPTDQPEAIVLPAEWQVATLAE